MGGNLLWLVHFLAGDVAKVLPLRLPPTAQLVLNIAKANLAMLRSGYLMMVYIISYMLLSLLYNGRVLTRYLIRVLDYSAQWPSQTHHCSCCTLKQCLCHPDQDK